ncbi:hypothetical protein NKG05_19860 [Oerskovia sp. M15]
MKRQERRSPRPRRCSHRSARRPSSRRVSPDVRRVGVGSGRDAAPRGLGRRPVDHPPADGRRWFAHPPAARSVRGRDDARGRAGRDGPSGHRRPGLPRRRAGAGPERAGDRAVRPRPSGRSTGHGHLDARGGRRPGRHVGDVRRA